MTEALYANVELLSLDAGNTVIFLDHERLARIADTLGHVVDVAVLVDAEGLAKRALSDGDSAMLDVAWSHRSEPGARGWAHVMATMFTRAGVAIDAMPALLELLWSEHRQLNLYSKVPEGFIPAMRDLRARGIRTAIVSNSEGMLDALFRQLGIAECFDAVVDSGKVGVEKPDPRIFAIACERTRTRAEHALHLGDTIATDVDGARAAGMRYALIDPFGHYAGLYPEVPRVSGVVEVAHHIAR